MNFLQHLRSSEAKGRGATFDGTPVAFSDLAERGYKNVPRTQTDAYKRSFTGGLLFSSRKP
jgi:hypothetical protein